MLARRRFVYALAASAGPASTGGTLSGGCSEVICSRGRGCSSAAGLLRSAGATAAPRAGRKIDAIGRRRGGWWQLRSGRTQLSGDSERTSPRQARAFFHSLEENSCGRIQPFGRNTQRGQALIVKDVR